ncbi:MAG: DUF3794 domain-containing protein [Eubacteriales bacterium]|nr:DUF3794 domain-containing protein [Eubacteriales bacterium]
MMDMKQDGLGRLAKEGTITPEILREELPLQRFVGEQLGQAVVEGEVALPGGLREETNVLSAEAMAVLDRTDVQAERVDAEGKVTFHVLYTQGDPTLVSALEASAEFSHAMDFAGALPGMNAPVSLMVEHVEANAQGGRLHLLAILRVQARVFSDEPLSVVTGVRGMDGLMQKTETLSCCRTLASGAQDVLVRDECELGAVLQIQDTLYATAIATVQDVMGGEEKATISGNILLEVNHRSTMPSRPIVVTRHTIPFEETLSLMGENGDQLCCDAVVKDVAVLSQEGPEEGGRTMRAEVLLGLSARATGSRDVCLLLDAYTTQGDLLLPVTKPVRRALRHHQVHTAESGKLTLLLDGQPPARTPLRAGIRPIVTDLNRSGGKLNVEGMMEVNLLYMTDDSEVPRSYQTEEPFRMSFTCDLSCPEGMVLSPSNIEVTGITSDRVEVKYILHVSCYDVQLGDEPLVTDVAEQPSKPAEPGILLCFSQEGESLWDIAKRYRVSCDSLKRMNPALEDGAAGEQVILWRR